MPLVSVVMSIYKEPIDYLQQSIESILNQTLEDFEFIIVLDCPDNKEALAYLNKCKRDNDHIKLLINENNIGLTASLNKALIQCTGKYIARMDADDISDVRRLEKQWAYLEKNQLDLVGCELRRISEKGAIINEKTNNSYAPECINKLIGIDDCIAHPSWFAKKGLYSRLGGYREIYTCEDYDFLLRAKKAGAKLGICDSILLSYRVNAKGISRSNSLRQQLSANYLRNNYKRLEEINDAEVKNYITTKMTESTAIRHEHALSKLNLGIERIKAKNAIGIIDIMTSPFISFFVIDNITRMVRMALIKRKYRRI